MVPVFAELDAMYGGGRARKALAGYLATDIGPALRAPGAPRDRQRLWISAARLSYLAGFMCFDENLNGAAQAYYGTAARLFADAGDLRGYTTVLRAMSIQAHHLGHYGYCLDLAERAVRHVPSLPPGQGALLTAQLAVATAARGDGRRSLAHLAHAERLLSRGDRDRDGEYGTIGVYHPAALAHQRAEVLASSGDRGGAIAALTMSLRARPSGERRARAVTTARLAGLQLDEGHLEQACATWNAFLDDLPFLQSARVGNALACLRARLRPYQGVSVARAVLARAQTLRVR